MHSIADVADCILERCGAMPTMKLQKLAFYSQARSLVVNGSPLFGEDFEAWENGPVSPELYALHKGRFIVRPGDLGRPIGGALRLTPAPRRRLKIRAGSCPPSPETSYPR